MKIPTGMDSVSGPEIAHGLLIVLLKEHHNGSVELSIASLENHMGDSDGRMWAFTIEPSETPGMVRLVTVDTTSLDQPASEPCFACGARLDSTTSETCPDCGISDPDRVRILPCKQCGGEGCDRCNNAGVIYP